MKIEVLSDLHLELHNPLPALADGVDVIVCAGDLAPINTGAVRYAAEEWARAAHILYVPGNHEYYGADIDRARKQLAEQCAMHGITLLDTDALVIDDVHFIGATLWTDFLLDGIAGDPSPSTNSNTVSACTIRPTPWCDALRCGWAQIRRHTAASA